MAQHDDLDARPVDRNWTRPEAYVISLARRRTARRSREPAGRTQPEAPRFALSTLPFLALMAGLAVLAVAIFAAAWPGSEPARPPQAAAQQEPGTAAKGWFQEAQREFNRTG